MAEKRNSKERTEIKNISDFLDDFITRLEKRNKNEGIDIISTGFSELDLKLNAGLTGGQFIIIAGRPAMGKSAYALNILENVSNTKERPVLLFSLEMGINEIITRLIIKNTGIDVKSLKTGNLDNIEMSKLAGILPYIKEINISVNDFSSHTEESIRETCLNFVEMYKEKCPEKEDHSILVCIDYLQLITSKTKNSNKNEEIGNITRSLKNLAKDINSPVIALSQLNRTLENRPNKRPQLADLKESGAIEQDADIVLAVYRNEYYHPEKEEFSGIAEIIILKHREGELGTIYNTFDGRRFMFKDMNRNDFLNIAAGAISNSNISKSKIKNRGKAIKDEFNDDEYHGSPPF